MSLPTRVLVTGASGFLGRALSHTLRGAGVEIAAIDLRGEKEIAEVDLRDRLALCAAVEATRPDAVVHAGAISGPMLARNDPALTFDVNIGGTLNLLEAMRRSGISTLVHLSSIAVYQPRADRSPVPEGALVGSDDAYGASKVAGEQIVGAYAAHHGICAWLLRVSSIFGASRATPYLIGEAIDAGVKGHLIDVTDDRSNMRQFVHVDDVVEAIRLALARRPEGAQPVNITGGTYLAELAIAELIREELPGLRIRVVPSKDRSGDGEIGPLDLGAASALLGYAPRAEFDQNVRSLARAAARTAPN